MIEVPPFRGDQVAAGVVSATTLVALLQLRLGWSDGGHLAFAGAATVGAAVLVGGLPREPRPYVSAIGLSFLVLLMLSLGRLAQVLGAEEAGPGTIAWVGTVLGVLAYGLARRHDLANATLVAALAFVVVPLAFFEWAIGVSAGVDRLLLLLAAIALALAGVSRRDRSPTHAAQLANAGGLALAGMLAVPDAAVLAPAFFSGGSAGEPGWGWQGPALVGGFGLLAYGAVDRQRGPVLVGLLVVATFVLSAGQGDGVLGWPLVLVAAATAGLVVGLRPTTELGPGPDDPAPGDPQAPVLPLR